MDKIWKKKIIKKKKNPERSNLIHLRFITNKNFYSLKHSWHPVGAGGKNSKHFLMTKISTNTYDQNIIDLNFCLTYIMPSIMWFLSLPWWSLLELTSHIRIRALIVFWASDCLCVCLGVCVDVRAFHCRVTLQLWAQLCSIFPLSGLNSKDQGHGVTRLKPV